MTDRDGGVTDRDGGVTDRDRRSDRKGVKETEMERVTNRAREI